MTERVNPVECEYCGELFFTDEVKDLHVFNMHGSTFI